MALAMNAHQRALHDAQQRIFIKLCAAFRRSHQNPGFRLLIETVRSELKIPANLFTEALENFSDAAGKPIVMVIEHDGARYLTLGESAKSNVSEWVEPPRLPGRTGFRLMTSAEPTSITKYGLRYAGAAIKNR